MTTETDVRKASSRFYAGLNAMANGDAAGIVDSWSHGDSVTALHPIGGWQIGWEAVRRSFNQFAELATDGRVELEDQVLHIAGDMACEVGNERGQMKIAGQLVTIDHRVTNVYLREDGAWKVVHHHTDISQPLVDVLEGLQPAPKKVGT